MRENSSALDHEERDEPVADTARPRVVYLQPPIVLGVLLERVEEKYRVRVGSTEAVLDVDPCVDPALLEEALETGARVVVDSATQTVCGLLTTSRSVRIDRNGDVRADVRRFEMNANEDLLLKTPGSFLHLDDDRVELFAKETLVRARGALRALARLIKLN